VDRRCTRSRVRVSVGERTAGSSSSFKGPEWWRRVRRPHTKVVAVDAATAATHRWTDGACGRGFGTAVGERTAGSSSSFRGAEWWRRVRRPHTKVVAVDAATAATHRWTDGACGRGFGTAVGERTAGSSSSFRGAEWWRRVRRLHTEVVAVDAATAATHRWTDGARGRGFGTVWGNGRRGRPRLSGGPSGGGAFVAHTPKPSPSTPPSPPLISGRSVRAVEGSGRCGGTDGSWCTWSESFSGAGVEAQARETRGVSKGIRLGRCTRG
jgi:hypothetical protein